MAMLLAGAFGAQAAGLGPLSVYSGIGQQLNAEVALNATPAELGSMSARIASPEAFKEAGIDYLPVLADLQIRIDKSASGQPVLKLTTVRPVTEPFLHFLVELSWGSGRVIREYTFLLDPPEMLQVARPASVVAPTAPASKPLPAPAAVKPAVSPTVVAGAPASSEYRVKPGDTLSKIARETRPESVTLDQMLVALLDNNRDAFDGGNMNRLRAGKILRIPAADEVARVDPATARKLVIEQTTEFAAYRRRLAGAVAAAPVAAAVPPQQVSGTIKPEVEDKTPPPPVKDKLEVSRTEPAKAKQAASGRSLEEDLIARDKALREASERIALLEKNIENLKKLIEIKSEAGAALQQQNTAAQPAPKAKPVEPAKSEASASKAEEAKPAAATESVPAKPTDTAPGAAVPAAPADISSQTAKPAVPPPAAKKPALPPPEAELSFVEENPEIVYGGGGLIALLLGYLGYASWRRKKAAAEKTSPAAAVAPAPTPAPVEAAPQSVLAPGFESGELSIQGEFSEGGLLTSEEIVDPVAEAEVLMAYGRDRQAEEVLQAGLVKDPGRSAIHMKLLELYAKQENLAQFEAVAAKLHELDKGHGPDWEKVVTMAHSLGLFGGIFAVGPTATEAVKPAAAIDRVEPAPTVESIQPEPIQPEPAAVGVSKQEALAPQAPETAAVENIPSLEFDLDLGSPAEVEPAGSEPGQARLAKVPAEETGVVLDFDFDLGSPEAEAAVVGAVEEAEAVAKENPPVLDFELDIGSPVEETAEAAEKTAAAEQPVDIDFDFDLNPATDTESGPPAEPSSADLSAVSVPHAETPAEPSPLPGIGDLKLDFDLDLEEVPTDKLPLGSIPEPSLAAEAQSVAAPVAPQEAEPDNAEAATKLELAQAYEEMGDLEGARELLNEVLNEGSPSQQAQAKAKLEQLSAS
ncbi:FimV/HubP family polar landmark protein [Sulfuricystis multivorans]|uniref:FimV/HubP family polar landmark protein n=1 Tax=Sulfuricystis multivorans TaxID=2211108 RepID=UPI000F816DF0|nr:FimV/HubP family polar landmark protein [Sulfuricystis multivorans]